MIKKILFGIILLFLNIVFVEVCLRLFNYVYPTSIFYREDYNQYRGIPHSDSYGFKLNAHGFKDVEYNIAKTPGTYRIVGVGDSFTFGVAPYPYNYLTLLEDTLHNMSTLPPVEIINMGICSTAPPHYLSIITDEALPLKPDMILLSVFVGNDIAESSRDSRKRKLFTYSYLASSVYYIYKVLTGLSQNGTATAYGKGYVYCDSCSTLDPERYLDIETQRSYVFCQNNTNFERHVQDALSYLHKINNLCKRRGIKLVVALLPDEMQVNTDLQKRVLAKGTLAAAAWDNEQPNRVLRQELEKANVPVVDLLNEFVARRQGPPLYIPNDSHWNIKGNRVAAASLAGQLPSLIAGP
ncbi:alginate O-acetyltransferase AlgX-related protein [Salmonirosea aquatica]|uniref:AlgX/AlgJ SGNH hydrolase-like domain-containing protein n=1 Tax=Salmonirosea aquatica TaxID=2654236 RepID=A0A7C9F4V6_9BACT|nr:hypothetical protein [Cytophagaceae bacterium SJW1-29]